MTGESGGRAEAMGNGGNIHGRDGGNVSSALGAGGMNVGGLCWSKLQRMPFLLM